MKVRCIDNKHAESLVTTGKVYEVVEYGDFHYNVRCNDGVLEPLFKTRFQPLDDDAALKEYFKSLLLSICERLDRFDWSGRVVIGLPSQPSTDVLEALDHMLKEREGTLEKLAEMRRERDDAIARIHQIERAFDCFRKAVCL